MASITVNHNNATDADFRAWGKSIGDQMVVGGWVRTADTGQIDWVTVLRPTGGSQNRGYEILRSNDAGGGLSQIFLKLEFGSDGVASAPYLWLTVGFASDGAGNLTGIISSRFNLPNNNGTPSNTPSYMAAGTGWVSMALFNGINMGIWFAIERTHDSTGNFNNEVVVLTAPSVTSVGSYIRTQVITPQEAFSFITPSSTNPVTQAIVNTDSSAHIVGTEASVSIQFAQKAGLTNPMISCFGAISNQFGPGGSTLSITSYGVTHTYIVTSYSSSIFPTFYGNTVFIVSRYE